MSTFIFASTGNDLADWAMLNQTRKVGDSDPTKATHRAGLGDNTLQGYI